MAPRITVFEPTKEEHNGGHWSVHSELGVGWPSSARMTTFLGRACLDLLGELWAFCKARFSLHTLLPSVSSCAWSLCPTAQCLECAPVFLTGFSEMHF